MNIAIIGTGYVGLVVGACLANTGNNVICIDNDIKKLGQLKNGILPIYEPGLEELIKVNVHQKRLTFSSDISNAIKISDICFITVGTPLKKNGSANLKYLFEAVESIAQAMNGYKIIVTKSTVPVGTAEKIRKQIKKYTAYPFDVVSNPEFLRQGNAVEDFLKPNRVVIGTDSDKAKAIMQKIYSPFVRTKNKIISMDIKSAEMTKYAANSFLATKISFINEIANLCEKIGADIDKVQLGISTDTRIGNKFLSPGVGYGGSCFPKDVKCLIKTGFEHNCKMSIIQSTDQVNYEQRKIFVNKIIKKFGNDLTGRTFAIWGLSFKPNTNDMREAPSITIINTLLEKGAIIKAYDPKAFENARLYFNDRITYSKTSYEALKDADALLILTEWNEFKRPNFEKIKENLKTAIIFDGRNLYDKQNLNTKGFEYYKIGK